MAVDGCSEMDHHHHRGPGNWGGGGDLTEFPPPQPLRLQEIQKEKKKGTLGTVVGYSPSLETRALSIDPIGRSSKRHHTLLREGPSDTDISEGFEFHDYRHEKVHVHVVTRTHTKPKRNFRPE